jgi:hypothetical protein
MEWRKGSFPRSIVPGTRKGYHYILVVWREGFVIAAPVVPVPWYQSSGTRKGYHYIFGYVLNRLCLFLATDISEFL